MKRASSGAWEVDAGFQIHRFGVQGGARRVTKPTESHPGMLRVTVVSSPLQERHLRQTDRRMGLPDSMGVEERGVWGERKGEGN